MVLGIRELFLEFLNLTKLLALPKVAQIGYVASYDRMM